MPDFGVQAVQKAAQTSHMEHPDFDLRKREAWAYGNTAALVDGSMKSGFQRSVEQLERLAGTERWAGCEWDRGAWAIHVASIVGCERASQPATATESAEEDDAEREGKGEQPLHDESMMECLMWKRMTGVARGTEKEELAVI
jgi:hypothetical protein